MKQMKQMKHMQPILALTVGCLPLLTCAQDLCDSVEVNSVHWSPFDPTYVDVEVNNFSGHCLDYPAWILFNDQGDTLAKETTNSFCVMQRHQMLRLPNAVIPDGAFTGRLELWTGFFTELICTYEDTFNLCPTTFCTNLWVTMYNWGQPIVGTFNWTVLDSSGTGVAAGQLELGAFQSNDTATVCLAPGNYVLDLVAIGQTNAFTDFGMSVVGGWLPEMVSTFVPGQQNQLPFSVYEHCVEVANAIAEPGATESLLIVQTGDQLILSRPDGGRIGNMVLTDVTGRIVLRSTGAGNSISIATDRLSTGVAVIRMLADDGAASVVKVLIE